MIKVFDAAIFRDLSWEGPCSVAYEHSFSVNGYNSDTFQPEMLVNYQCSIRTVGVASMNRNARA